MFEVEDLQWRQRLFQQRVCVNGICAGSRCENFQQDSGETDVDCGGVCGGARCATGKGCSMGTDCISGICSAGLCVSDPCKDRVRNGAETDVDCGGNICTTKCALTKRCVVGTDCASNLCSSATNTCVDGTCGDGVLTVGSESDVDCGSACAATNPAKKCGNNKQCAADSDCSSGVCNQLAHVCVASTCFDGIKNGSETATDCGGACEPKCGYMQACTTGTDCQSGACTVGLMCAQDQCSDGLKNGSETGTDCGGSCATKCMEGVGCVSNNDCAHPSLPAPAAGFCNAVTHTCAASSCNTGTKDGNETGIDCGGTCGLCGNGQGCVGASDCGSGICRVTAPRICVATQCEDGIKNNQESDIDCGGGSVASGGCGYNTCLRSGGLGGSDVCVNNWDCQSGYCGTSNTCVPTIPKSCNAYMSRGLPGDNVSGLKEIDPDGPSLPGGVARAAATNGAGGTERPPVGWISSVITWCDQSTDGGGWTPAIYINSARLELGTGTWPHPTVTGWSYMNQRCTQDSNCTPLQYGSKCVQVPGAAATEKFCQSPYSARDSSNVWVSGIGGNGPAYYSVSQTLPGNPSGYLSYAMEIRDPNCSSSDGLIGVGNAPLLLRWAIYRNGSLLPGASYSGVSGYTYGSCPFGNNRSEDVSPMKWFHGDDAYMQGTGGPSTTSPSRA